MTPHLGLVVAKKGINAETATDPNDFIFHSDYNSFKIIKENTLSVNVVALTNNQTFLVSHGQTFIPLATAFAKQSDKAQVFLPNSDNVNLYGPKLGWTSTGIRFNYVQSDADHVSFNFDNSDISDRTVNIRYFLLERATT